MARELHLLPAPREISLVGRYTLSGAARFSTSIITPLMPRE